MKTLETELEAMEIEPLTDEALESVAGGKSSDAASCCSCFECSRGHPEGPPPPPDEH